MSLRAVAEETLAILRAGHYQTPAGAQRKLASEQAQAVAGTRVWSPAELAELARVERASGETPVRVEVVDATTQVAACTLAADGRMALLNFASAKNPGGGFLGGARAQEEDLARCSGLYPCLAGSTARPYYTHNRSQRSFLYSDFMVFSPGVPFFRSCSRRGESGWLLEQFFRADVVTAPAPNAGAARRRRREQMDVAETLRRRAGYVLALAAQGGATQVVLGAWGCGVFRNDPAVVAEAFFSHLEAGLGDGFERVVFAIPQHAGKRNYDAFVRRLADSPLG